MLAVLAVDYVLLRHVRRDGHAVARQVRGLIGRPATGREREHQRRYQPQASYLLKPSCRRTFLLTCGDNHDGEQGK
jgi:hypothetical protein